MRIKISCLRESDKWTDPLLTYIHGHMLLINDIDDKKVIPNMDTLFGYVNHLVEEFIGANTRYRKPIGFSISYNKPFCCAATIRVAVGEQTLILLDGDVQEQTQTAKFYAFRKKATAVMLLLALCFIGCMSQKPTALHTTGTAIMSDHDRLLIVFEDALSKPGTFGATWFYFPGEGKLDIEKYRVKVVLEEIQ